MNAEEKLKELRIEAHLGGGLEKQNRQKQQGKWMARDRIDALFDLGTWVEIDGFRKHNCRDFGLEHDRPLGDGVLTGFGKIHGKTVYCFAQDFTVFGGSLSLVHAEKIIKIMDLALKAGCPIIGLNDSGGARIQEGVASLGGYAEIFWRNVQASGVIPQISVILGPCAGGAVYSPAITDFVVMSDSNSYLFVTGPDVIKTVTHEEVTKEDLGGPEAHGGKSGVAHYIGSGEKATLQWVRTLLQYLPSNNCEGVPLKENHSRHKDCSRIAQILPSSSQIPYDVKEVIFEIVDDDTFLEIHQNYAQNIVVGFARLGGRSIGIVANQPAVLAGCLDINASVKAARFVRFCDSFQIPILTLVDVPGFLPGVHQEYGGIIRHGAKLLYAYAEATVPKVTLILRKAYGGAYDVMASKHIRADFNFAYPQAEIAVMGAEGAVQVLYRNEISKAETQDAREKLRQKYLIEYREKFAHPYRAAELGYLDDVILPSETRAKLLQVFSALENKREERPKRKHGNIPL